MRFFAEQPQLLYLRGHGVFWNFKGRRFQHKLLALGPAYTTLENAILPTRRIEGIQLLRTKICVLFFPIEP